MPHPYSNTQTLICIVLLLLLCIPACVSYNVYIRRQNKTPHYCMNPKSKGKLCSCTPQCTPTDRFKQLNPAWLRSNCSLIRGYWVTDNNPDLFYASVAPAEIPFHVCIDCRLLLGDYKDCLGQEHFHKDHRCLYIAARYYDKPYHDVLSNIRLIIDDWISMNDKKRAPPASLQKLQLYYYMDTRTPLCLVLSDTLLGKAISLIKLRHESQTLYFDSLVERAASNFHGVPDPSIFDELNKDLDSGVYKNIYFHYTVQRQWKTQKALQKELYMIPLSCYLSHKSFYDSHPCYPHDLLVPLHE